mgnify:CR=1 FL=1
MNIFQVVKENVTARQAAEQYGLKVNKNGMVCCPFHDDRHPSMKVDKGFCCFACGTKGDVITFVADFFHLTPLEAAKKLLSQGSSKEGNSMLYDQFLAETGDTDDRN